MHTLNVDGVSFNFHSDLSGNVIIRYYGMELEIPGTALLALAADYIRAKKIAALGEACDLDILLSR